MCHCWHTNKWTGFLSDWCQAWLCLPMGLTSIPSLSVAGTVSAGWSYWWSLGSSRVENSTSRLTFSIFLKVSIMLNLSTGWSFVFKFIRLPMEKTFPILPYLHNWAYKSSLLVYVLFRILVICSQHFAVHC